ncbi:MAG: family 78 glycoside hydrolase catalytic domain [Clostridia bacterium]|nr:family 78 glycoside hydrolase catalytic domain [Clostridia bacterium]
MLKLYDFSIDYVKNPTLIRTRGLRFGWKPDSDQKDTMQTSYRITVTDEAGNTAFDTGTVSSDEYFDICPEDLALDSRTDYTVTVTVTDNHGECAALSHPVHTEILPDEWGGMQWIKPKKHISGWAPYLRTKFETKNVKKAVLYASGLGCAEYYINGTRIEDYVVDPPMTNYEKTVLYRAFDVTEYLCNGGNALCVLLGEGFYAQSRVWGWKGFVYGNECLAARLEITLDDGTKQVIVSDTEHWKYKYSPISSNNIYAGETYDCRLETPDFALYDGEEDEWGTVVADETPKGVLTPCLMPPVREIRRLPAKNVWCASGKDDGAWIFDIGENMAGTVEFHLPQSPRGAVYVFRYAENLTAARTLDVRSTGAFATQCIQQDMYISRGDAAGEVFRPRLSYHGFRYVEVTGIHDLSKGYGTMPRTEMLTGIQLSTDMKITATIRTPDADWNALLSVMQNTYQSNFHGLPEDCPAREKCGWLGDAEVVCNYGLLNYDSTASYEKYLDDIRSTTEVYGTWQMISPGKRGCGEASPLWGCAQIILPYYMYRYCGDREAVTRNWDLMEKWVQHELARSEDYLISEGLGDWDPAEGNNGPRRMPVTHSSTLMFYEICIRMAELAETFGYGDPAYYRDLAAKIKESFIRHFYCAETDDYGYWGTDGVALLTGLYPDGGKAALLAGLRRRMAKDDFAMPTGIYANKYLVPALMEAGYGDDAMRFLFNREHPSFGTMLDDGATSMWEAPDMKNIADPDKGVSSYNHPMHGGFLYAVNTHLCGIRPTKPGFAEFAFAPCFVAGMDDVSMTMHTAAGKIAVSIRENGDAHVCTLYVPTGTRCTVDAGGDVTVNGEAYSAGTTLGSGEYTVVIG